MVGRRGRGAVLAARTAEGERGRCHKDGARNSTARVETNLSNPA